jgi:KUP system potassium uptake protein
MRADNDGEGGILALMSLVGMNDWKRGTYIGASMGLLGAALIYGDGVITPAISVLSALEGVNVATTALKPYIVPLALVILVGLFAAQRFGTATIGKAFGPVMLMWFLVIGALGLVGVVHHPAVLKAIDPLYGIRLLLGGKVAVLALLGGVFLCATGGEALYADMGHIGRMPIRLAWYVVVLPSLLLNYAGQTGVLLDGGGSTASPFFRLVPDWGLYPLVVLATLATIIASQAIITGSFSMTRQAMQLGWLPGFDIRQTSDKVYGQIYVPVVNVLMMAGTIAVTLAFRTSDALAGAYGTAVSTTMVLTTLLLIRAMTHIWKWSPWQVIAVAGVFGIVDVTFFAANLTKIAEGGWVPLSIGVAIYLVMVTWRTGAMAVRQRLRTMAEPTHTFVAQLNDHRIPRVPGTAVFLTRTAGQIPAFIAGYMRNMGSLHDHVIALTIKFDDVPRIADARRATVEQVCEGFWRATVHFGFIEVPDLTAALKELKGLPDSIDLDRAVFFGSRDMVTAAPHSAVNRLRIDLFAFLYRNAVRASDRFKLPPDRTIEVARQIKL